VAGRPAAIVVTSGALAVLDPPQLDAVLAHESAHLAQRHHVLTTVTRGLAAAVPGVPLFACGAEETARLAEMAADDVAAGRVGRAALVTALLAIATGTAVPSTDPVPANGLAAASRAVPARVERLMAPPRAAAAITGAAALTALALALALAPAALTFLFLSFRRAASSLAEAPAHG
jgi:Zn-dependent protease with chaperone function